MQVLLFLFFSLPYRNIKRVHLRNNAGRQVESNRRWVGVRTECGTTRAQRISNLLLIDSKPKTNSSGEGKVKYVQNSFFFWRFSFVWQSDPYPLINSPW